MDRAAEERAIFLHVAGHDVEAISRTVERDVAEIEAVLEAGPHDRELEERRLDALWTKWFTKSLGSDDEALKAAALCLRIQAARGALRRDWRNAQAAPGRAGTDVERLRLGTPDDLQRAWQMMAGDAPDMVGVLDDVARNAKSDHARVMAATAILDRVGLGVKQDVTVRTVPVEYDQSATGTGGRSAADMVEDRLEMLAAGGTISAPGRQDDDVVDAELVGDEPAAD